MAFRPKNTCTPLLKIQEKWGRADTLTLCWHWKSITFRSPTWTASMIAFYLSVQWNQSFSKRGDFLSFKKRLQGVYTPSLITTWDTFCTLSLLHTCISLRPPMKKDATEAWAQIYMTILIVLSSIAQGFFS